ncbi:hypothetical protein CDAR_588961 [Caerostris darwini]|uniref:Uncharacterized protein n=1 Tax=Caerostris darwini TaxID=1538125 RepID=A0AAV4R475_9ARAC|nr:hypothetical protein CDAR_588961 [Caerostris darwini]
MQSSNLDKYEVPFLDAEIHVVAQYVKQESKIDPYLKLSPECIEQFDYEKDRIFIDWNGGGDRLLEIRFGGPIQRGEGLYLEASETELNNITFLEWWEVIGSILEDHHLVTNHDFWSQTVDNANTSLEDLSLNHLSVLQLITQCLTKVV